MKEYTLEFDKPDEHEQKHASLDLDHIIPSGERVLFNIDGKSRTYAVQYTTIGEKSINGILSNVDHNWNNMPFREDYPIIQFIGKIDESEMRLSCWITWK